LWQEFSCNNQQPSQLGDSVTNFLNSGLPGTRSLLCACHGNLALADQCHSTSSWQHKRTACHAVQFMHVPVLTDRAP
jgi:hypothetical protein